MRRYKKSDYPDIGTWYAKKGLNRPAPESLAKVGFIEPGVAAGFLYKCEGGFALLDGYVANPESDKEERDKALDEITAALLAHAEEKGFRCVLAYTELEAVSRRAEKHGMRREAGLQTLLIRKF